MTITIPSGAMRLIEPSLQTDGSGLVPAPSGEGYVLAKPAGRKSTKATSTKTSSAIVALAVENAKLRKQAAEQPKTPETPQRDEIAFKGLGDNMAKYARGVKFVQPRVPAAFRKGGAA